MPLSGPIGMASGPASTETHTPHMHTEKTQKAKTWTGVVGMANNQHKYLLVKSIINRKGCHSASYSVSFSVTLI